MGMTTVHCRKCLERLSQACDEKSRCLRTLLVEDDFTCRMLLQSFLSRYGQCDVAVNGREAVEAYRAAHQSGQRYDLICMDILMPEMSGRDAVAHIRAIEEEDGLLSCHGARIAMVTQLNELEEVSRCYEQLCDAYLTKPIQLPVLLERMIEWQLIH